MRKTGYSWVKTIDLETLKARIKNIRIRMLKNIKTPSVVASGTGPNASILITLPKYSSTTPFSSSEIRFAVIKSSVDTWNYTADIYANPDEDPVETDVTVKINQNQLADGEVIPSGTCLEVRKQYHGTGDNKQQYWTVIGLSRSY